MNNAHCHTIDRPVNTNVLENGIKLLVLENPTADIIAGKIFIKSGGSLWENKEKAGLAHLMMAVLTKGTRNLSNWEITEQIESTAASLSGNATSDYLQLSLKTVTDDFVDILKLAGEILRYPSFPLESMELEKKLTIQGIRSQQEQAFNVAFKTLREMMYQDHPYGWSLLGTEETVRKISQEDLINYHQTYVRPDQIVISLAGNITNDRALEIVQETFGNWQNPPTSLPTLKLPAIKYQPYRKPIKKNSQQAIVMLGYMGVNVHHPDYLGLKLLSSYLGNGLSSRLFVELREKQGLAYEVSTFYSAKLEPTQFVVYMGTASQNIKTAWDGLYREVDRLSNQTLTEQEVEHTKNKFLGQYALGKQTNGDMAQTYGYYEVLGLGWEFDREFITQLQNLTPTKLQEIAQTYLTKPYGAIVGKLSLGQMILIR